MAHPACEIDKPVSLLFRFVILNRGYIFYLVLIFMRTLCKYNSFVIIDILKMLKNSLVFVGLKGHTHSVSSYSSITLADASQNHLIT